jgi:polyketide biosynthesis enoyl-CoA hydratase PksH
MPLETITIQQHPIHTVIQLNRPTAHNAINTLMLAELHETLNNIALHAECRVVILEGSPAIFSAGMDLDELALRFLAEDHTGIHGWAIGYMAFLKRLTTIPQIVITKLEGKAIAGAVGLAAASDLVIASPNASFKLTETRWGLIPAMVTPFLVRRVGFQAAYKMTLTTETLLATEAHASHLIDEIYDDIEQGLNQQIAHFEKLPIQALKEVKTYYGNFSNITQEMEIAAVNEITRLLLQPHVQEAICKVLKK